MTMGPGEAKLNHAAELLKEADRLSLEDYPDTTQTAAVLVIAHALVGIGEMLADARRQDVEETEAYRQRLAERDGR